MTMRANSASPLHMRAFTSDPNVRREMSTRGKNSLGVSATMLLLVVTVAGVAEAFEGGNGAAFANGTSLLFAENYLRGEVGGERRTHGRESAHARRLQFWERNNEQAFGQEHQQWRQRRQERRWQRRQQQQQEQTKNLFPMESSDIITFFFATIGLMLAAGGGVGGGGMLVPLYILILGFTPKLAIPLSNVTVFGGAVANTIINAPKRHPLADRPVIDWDLILIMEPLTISGALIGGFLNKALPEMTLVVLLVLVLSFTAYSTLKKACKMYVRETKAAHEERRIPTTAHRELEEIREKTTSLRMKANESVPVASDVSPSTTDSGSSVKHSDRAINNGNKVDVIGAISLDYQLYGDVAAAADKPSPESSGAELGGAKGDSALLKQILDEERETPLRNVRIIVIMFLVVLSVNIMKGGGGFSLFGIECGSAAFWLAQVFMHGWVLAVFVRARSYLIRRTSLKNDAGYVYIEGDIVWDEKGAVVYPLICCVAGFFAGMFGIGGGIVKGPLMLALGVHPAVSSATSACMILFTSFTASTSFAVFGLLVPDYAVLCLVVGFVATVLGQTVMSWLLRKQNRNSYIAFSIGLVVLLSAIMLAVEPILRIGESGKDVAEDTGGIELDSGGICSLVDY